MDDRLGRLMQVNPRDVWRGEATHFTPWLLEPADFPVYEGTGDDDRTFWWRYPTGTKAIADEADQPASSDADSALAATAPEGGTWTRAAWNSAWNPARPAWLRPPAGAQKPSVTC